MANEVTTKEINWAAQVQKMWGKEYKKPEVVYQWSNGREFKSTDNAESGIYKRT